MRHVLNVSRLRKPHTLTPPNTITLLLPALTFRPFLLHPSIKPSTITLRSYSDSPHKNQVICIQEVRQSPLSSLFLKSHSPPPHPHFHLLHHFVHIYTLKSQGDIIHTCLTPLLILKHSLSPPFSLTQAILLTYILLIPINSSPPTS